ncbi:MAG: cbb3-type cytochrome c oxidase subunit I [Verrucomicrobiota bacterium]
MTTDENSTQGSDAAEENDAKLRAYIDSTTRLPVLFFFTSAAVWLVISAVLGVISSTSLKSAAFFPIIFTWFNETIWVVNWVQLDWYQLLGYGRVYPAFMSALIYGWGIQAGIGAGLWIMARLCRVPFRNTLTLIVAGHLWNIGVTMGMIALICGNGTSVPWLDFPFFVWPFLLAAYLVVTVWIVVMFRSRRSGPVYVSQWYLLAAFLVFPWLYLTANLFLHAFKGSAVMGAAIGAWYSSALLYLWFVPIALAAAYYLVPKILGRPIYSNILTKIGFWSMFALAGWTGMQRYLGGPLPSWMPAVGAAATIGMVLPLIVVVTNLYMTVRDQMGYMQYSPTLRFTMFGLLGFVMMVLVGAGMSFFEFSKFLQFTMAVESYEMAGLYWFFSMTMFAAFYFIGPRVTGCEWLSRGMIRWHFWFSAYGSIVLAGWMLVGGISQGATLYVWDTPVAMSVEILKIHIVAEAIAWIMIIISNLMFLFHTGLMCLRLGRRSGMEPTLIHELPKGAGPDAVATEGAAAS